MSLQKQLEYNKYLFMYRVLNNKASESVSNLHAHPPSRYSNSRNYHLDENIMTRTFWQYMQRIKKKLNEKRKERERGGGKEGGKKRKKWGMGERERERDSHEL